MKKLKLLFAFIAFSFLSCSDDNDPSTLSGGDLDKYVFTLYNDNGQINGNYDIKFDNNRMTGIYFYRQTGEVVDKREFFYNESGSLSKLQVFRDDETEPYIVQDLSYDNEGKIEDVEERYISEFGKESATTGHYTYNSDNTITYMKQSEDGTTVFTTTYYKNSLGQVYKLLSDDGYTEEVTYEGDNVASYNRNGQIYSYTFDNVNTPVGPILESQVNQMAGNMQNTILYFGFQQITLGVSKYVTGQSSNTGSGNASYNYEFFDNHPVVVKYFYEGSTTPYAIRQILYK